MTNPEVSLQDFQNRIQAMAEAEGLPWLRNRFQRALKRLLDVLIAAPMLLAIAPVLLITAIMVRVTSPGPVLLRQTRLGLNARPYSMLKFRSMVAANPDGSAGYSGEVTAQDFRLTPIGGFIRAWRIDELPQLWHVLTGEMSLIGPRPDIIDNVGLYSGRLLLRFAMPPGCSTLAFVRGGFENDWQTRQAINTEYVEQWSFMMDISIILKSAVVLLRQQEANPSHSATSDFGRQQGGDSKQRP